MVQNLGLTEHDNAKGCQWARRTGLDVRIEKLMLQKISRIHEYSSVLKLFQLGVQRCLNAFVGLLWEDGFNLSVSISTVLAKPTFYSY